MFVPPSGSESSHAPPAPGAGIVAEQWSFRYPGRARAAVVDATFTVEPGQVVVLLGASGSGKSTLLRGLAGVLPEGVITGVLQVASRSPLTPGSTPAPESSAAPGPTAPVPPASVPTGPVPTARGPAPLPLPAPVGLVLQDPQSNVVMETVGDDLAFPLENRGVEPVATWARVERSRTAVGLEPGRERRTTTLSGGQLQLLAIAAATIGAPPLVLLDEPTANLDSGAAEAVVRTVLAERARTGCTVVVIEHRVAPWLSRADLVLVADRGTITAVAPDDLTSYLAERPGLAERVWLTGTDLPARGPSAPAGDVALRADDIGVTSRLASTGVSCRAGEVVALTGPPGSGKSTLLACLAGLLEPDTGRVEVADGRRDPWAWPASAVPGTFGVVFQNPEHQFLAGSVRSELEHGLEPDDVAVRTRVDELLLRLALRDLEAADPFGLSGGEQRRLSVATALVARPDVLLLDEPTFGQDPATWREVVGIIAEHRDAGGAVVIATHDTLLVEALSAREVRLTPVSATTGDAGSAQSGFAQPGSSQPAGLRSLDPLALLATAALLTIAALLSASVPFNLALAASALAAGLLGGLSVRWVGVLAIPAMVATGSVALSNALLSEHGLLSWQSWQAAALPASRILAVAIPGLIVAVAMDPTGLADSLVVRLRVGPRVAYGVLAGLRLLPLLADEWSVLARASRARGLGGRGLVARGRLFASMAFRLLVSALRRGGRLAVALDARGLTNNRERTIARPVRWRGRDSLAMAVGFALLVLGIMTR